MAKTFANIGSNPLQVVQDPRVVSTAFGVLGANLTRKALYTQQRGTFGFAAKGPDGRIYYYTNAEEAKKGPSAGRQVPSARQNRLFLNLGGVLLGTLLMGYGEEGKDGDVLTAANNDDTTKVIKFAALGLAGSSFANTIMALFEIE